MNDIKLWYALIPSVDVDETSNAADNNNNNNNSGGDTEGDVTNDGVGGGGMSSSFVNGGQSSSSPSQSQQEEVHYFRINQSGSISAYNINRQKIWDSHLNLGVYTPLYYSLGGEMIEDGKGENSIVSNMLNDKISGSVLTITEDGNVVIQGNDEEKEQGEVVTWSISPPPSLEDKEVVSISGLVFYDVNSNGLNDDSSLSPSSTSTISLEEKGEVVLNVIVDLYDCSSSTSSTTSITEEEDEWILVTRTNNVGEYKFTVPNTNIEDDESTNLSSYLKERGISNIRAVFTLPTTSSTAVDGGDTISYSFSPTSKDSDVNNIGSTSCWDLNDGNENNNIIWNAGIITSQEQSTTPQEEVVETMPTAATTQETTGTGIVGGYAFLDINNDGIRNNNNPNSSTLQLDGGVESSMSNVNIQLYKCTPDEEVSSASSSFFSSGETSTTSSSTNDDDDELLAVTNTNTQGLYTFLNLLQGNYRIKVSPISGYTTSSSIVNDNTINPTTWSTICFALDNDVTDLSWDVGLVQLMQNDAAEEQQQPPPPVPPSTVTISGLVFQDTNNNGIFDQQQQEEEYALMDVQVALFDCSGKIIYITTSDDNGMYGFEDIPTPGSYYVKFSPPIGYEISSFWTGGSQVASSDLNNHAHPDHGRTECVEYTGNGDDEYALDAGFVPNGEGITFDQSRPTPSPTSRGTFKGDGTACSGSKCPLAGMCRNQSGLCGVGITFCNPNNVWDSTCPEKDVVTPSPAKSPTSSPSTTSPTISNRPSFTPSLSYRPTQSTEPTTLQITSKVSICNEDGSYGVINDNNNVVQPTEVSFTYALKSNNGLFPTIDMITQIEEDLARRLACIYFPNASCISCDEQQRTLMSLNSRREEENAKEGEDSNAMLGITSWPIDVPSPVEVCSGSSNSDCRVINGKIQAYFPKNMSSDRIEEERSLFLRNIEYEMDKNDWPGGMQVSYDNGPFPQVNAAEGGNNNSGGLSGGAVAGIVIALLAIVAISSVLFIRSKREKDEQQDLFDRQQQAAGAVPYGSEDHHDRSYMTGSFGGHDESDYSESDDSSRSDDSESSGSLSFTRSIGKASAVSGDTFPTVAAQARPQDIEDDGAYSSEGESDEEGVSEEEDDDESYSSSVGSSEPNLIPPQAEQMDHEYNILRRLQQSSASDDHAAVYEDRRLSSGEMGEQQGGRQYYEDNSDNYDVQHQQEGDYDDGNYPVQEELRYQDEQSMYPPQKYTQSQNEPNHVDQIDDTISLNSADPPGQSYRDLPQPDDYWDHTHPPPTNQQPMMHHNGNVDMGYVDDTDSQVFQVYESERGLNDSYHSSSSVHYNNGDGVDSHSNSGSHHSNQSHDFDSSNRSHHSQGSRPSIHSQEGSSRRSIHSQGSRHSIHSQGSHHSRHSQGSQENVQYYHNQPPEHYDQYDQGQYVNDGSNQFNGNHQAYTDGSQEYTEEEGHYDNHNQGGQGLPPPPLFHGNDYHPQQYSGGSNNMGHEPDHSQYRNSNMPEMTNQYHQQQRDSGAAPYEQYSQGGRVNDVFGEESYNSFHSIIPPPPSSNHHRPEELDEVSTTGSAYTAKTQQVSNTSSSNNEGHQLPQNPYDGGEEGENIANVFKSLSEIQSRLANNKKQQPQSEYLMPEQAIPQDDIRGSNNRDDSDDVYPGAAMHHHHSNGSSNGWGKEGVVEDASMDGSQMSNLNTNPTRNRLPQQGQWMEPVDED